MFHSKVSSQDISKWNYGLAFAPSISRKAPISNTHILTKEEFPRSRFSYAAGIYFIRKAGRNTALQFGLGYMHKKIVNVENVTMPNGLPNEVGIIQNIYNDLEIPVLYRLFYGKKNYIFSPSFGAIGGINIKQTIIAQSESINFSHVYKGRNINLNRYNLVIGLGNIIKINKKNFLLIEPYYKLDISQLAGKAKFYDDTNRTLGIICSLYFEKL